MKMSVNAPFKAFIAEGKLFRQILVSNVHASVQ